MHFSYVKTKFLHRWLNILCNYVHSRTFTTPNIHPPPTTMPPPPPSAPPPDPASHPTLPPIPPCQPPHLAHHPTRATTTHPVGILRQGHDGVAIVATRWCHPRHSAKAVCVGCRSTSNPIQYSTRPIKYPTYRI